MVNTHNEKSVSKFNYSFLLKMAVLTVFLLAQPAANADFVPFETTRIKSTAGTGVASLLMDEASSLNPASLAFFTISSIYLQRTKESFSRYQAGSDSSQPQETDLSGIIISDAKGRVKGSFSYHKQYNLMDERQQYGVSLASAGGPQSSMGLTYLHTRDRLYQGGGNYDKNEFHQLVFGITHALNQSVTIGTVVFDPTKEREGETRAIVGVQYTFRNFIYLMADLGSDYNQALSESVLYRGAAQFKIFDDFFMRFGASNDRGRGEKSSGIGIGWVQPRLVINLSLKNTSRQKSITQNRDRMDLRESSFSLSYHF